MIALRPIERLIEPSGWTEADNRLVEAHFRRPQRLTAEGQVLLAGRALSPDARQFGLVVVEAGSEADARAIMEGDPAVEDGPYGPNVAGRVTVGRRANANRGTHENRTAGGARLAAQARRGVDVRIRVASRSKGDRG